MRCLLPTSAQEAIHFCGTHVKWGDVPQGYDGPVYYDRFGNKYTEYELQRETEGATNHCTSGAFVLNFIGGFPFTVVAGGSFDSDGEAQITLSDEDGDPNCVTLTLTLEVGSNVSPGTLATIGMGATSEDACVNTSESNGDAVLVLETCTTDPERCECPSLANNYNIGMNENSVTYLDMSGLPASLDDACLAINGQLIVNRDFLAKNSYIIMNRGAEIVVAPDNYLQLYHNFIEGCEHLWRSITVQHRGRLSCGTNEIADALYAIRAENGSRISATTNTFDKNFVGIYVPPSATNAPQTVTLIPKGIAFNKFICSDDLTGRGFAFHNTCDPTDFKWSHITNVGQYGLYLDPKAVIGIQTHKFNQWHSGSGGARHESDNSQFILKSQFRCASDLIPTFSTGAGAISWFLEWPNSPYSSPYPACPPSACPDVVYPDPDERETALASTDTTTAVLGLPKRVM